MTTKLTLFTATFVQDSALSVSGLDRETSADQPFALVNGVPTLVGRGLKGAAVAMARRFFDPLPRAVSTTSSTGPLTLGAAAKLAEAALGEALVAWWCDPTIDLDLHTSPATFEREWPAEDDKLQVDEIACYAERAVWRAVRTESGARFIVIEGLDAKVDDTKQTRVVHTPARPHACTAARLVTIFPGDWLNPVGAETGELEAAGWSSPPCEGRPSSMSA